MSRKIEIYSNIEYTHELSKVVEQEEEQVLKEMEDVKDTDKEEEEISKVEVEGD